MTEKKTVVITQNVPLMREALKARQYFKQCGRCDVCVTTRSRNKRVCPRCGGTLKKTDERPDFNG